MRHPIAPAAFVVIMSLCACGAPSGVDDEATESSESALSPAGARHYALLVAWGQFGWDTKPNFDDWSGSISVQSGSIRPTARLFDRIEYPYDPDMRSRENLLTQDDARRVPFASKPDIRFPVDALMLEIQLAPGAPAEVRFATVAFDTTLELTANRAPQVHWRDAGRNYGVVFVSHVIDAKSTTYLSFGTNSDLHGHLYDDGLLFGRGVAYQTVIETEHPPDRPGVAVGHFFLPSDTYCEHPLGRYLPQVAGASGVEADWVLDDQRGTMRGIDLSTPGAPSSGISGTWMARWDVE
jgi:hypothetical protein